MLNVTLVPVLDDNYAYILQSGDAVAVLDPGEAGPLIDKLVEMALSPTLIFNTHHHGDHINGNDEIVKKYGAKIIGPEKENHRINNMSKTYSEGDDFTFGEETVTVLETPGHTSGHICFWFQESQILFSGDTLFSMGCGRLFEGTADDIYPAFRKFNTMPDETIIYCGHEYTQANGEFCLSIEPENDKLIQRMKDVKNLREQGTPTIPTTMGLEKETNVFMRAKDAVEFKKYRDLKDNF